MSLKFKHYLSVVLLIATHQLFGQRTVETYYDYGRTKLHEVYTTTDEPPYRKHGNYKKYDAKGNLMLEKNYKDGKQHGTTTSYYYMIDHFQKDCYGTLSSETEWKDGVKHGWDKSWRCNKGELTFEFETFWVEGEEEIRKRYYRNGVLGLEGRYNGQNKEWEEDGTLLMEYITKDGVEHGPKTTYHSDGHIHKQGNMVNGDPSGRWIGYEMENGTYVKSMVDIDPIKGTVTPVNE